MKGGIVVSKIKKLIAKLDFLREYGNWEIIIVILGLQHVRLSELRPGLMSLSGN